MGEEGDGDGDEDEEEDEERVRGGRFLSYIMRVPPFLPFILGFSSIIILTNIIIIIFFSFPIYPRYVGCIMLMLLVRVGLPRMVPSPHAPACSFLRARSLRMFSS